jgi:hypothetical protein
LLLFGLIWYDSCVDGEGWELSKIGDTFVLILDFAIAINQSKLKLII